MSIGYIKIPCSFCGKEYETSAIDCHIGYPHICGDCLREVVSKWADEMKESIDKKIEGALLG